MIFLSKIPPKTIFPLLLTPYLSIADMGLMIFDPTGHILKQMHNKFLCKSRLGNFYKILLPLSFI
ncbi:MAG: hypothetical protein C0596_02895 [Marinilabiliales bacterium]|nr:MAG: hypothetical protein C0596_02895 [Marinilabiliales bacterium]